MSDVVFKVGPVETHDGPISTYFVFPGKPEHQAFMGSNDRLVLGEIAAFYGAAELEGEPALASAAEPLGIGTRELTPDEAHHLGLVTFDLALPRKFAGVKASAAIYHLATACRFFYDASPWTRPAASQTVEIAVTGSTQRRLRARILGAPPSKIGLALYPGNAAISPGAGPFANGELSPASTIDTLGVTLDDAPAYAVDAMQRAYGLPGLPNPLKLESGKRVSPDDLDLLTLAAALRAVASLSDDSNEANAQVGLDELEVWALAYR